MTRPWTDDVKTETGTRITVKRSCNGCGRQIGDVNAAELEAAVCGADLPDVREECGCVKPARPTLVVVHHPPAPVPTDPCANGYHRWAWLVDGRQACGYCGRPR